MGQHKHNPTAQLAKEGKLPPKPKKMSKREQEAELNRIIFSEVFKRSPQAMSLVAALSDEMKYK